MFRLDPLSRFASLSSREKTVVLVMASGLLAFFIWTLPNWGVFWEHVPQLLMLWHVPANRIIILALLIKVTSPLWIMVVIEMSVWIYFQLQPLDDNLVADNRESEHARDPEAREQRDALVTVLEREPVSPLPQPLAAGSRHYHPETPLPPTLSSQKDLERQEDSSTLFSSREQQAMPGRQTGEKSTALPALPINEGVQTDMPGSGSDVSANPLISIHLLKDVRFIIHEPGGNHVVVPLTLNAKRVQLLACIAWRRGELMDRDKILEHIFGWGLPDEEATEDKLSERFESHKKLLRKKIREVVVEQVNKPAGKELIDPDIDPFVSNAGFWGLAPFCRVEDLEEIERDYKVIALAKKDGKLLDDIPAHVHDACTRLIAAYTGDFLETLIRKYPAEFRPFHGLSSWARKPYTLYRDYYLDALWYSAEFAWRQGQHGVDGQATEGQQRTQQEHYGKAAQFYQTYAMYACNSKFDAKATFSVHGEYGERVGMSERALRRCVALLGTIGQTGMVDQVWSAYYTQMKSISDQRWEPSAETRSDLAAARAQTSGYRFSSEFKKSASQDQVS